MTDRLAETGPTGMCPHCGEEVSLGVIDGLTAFHDYPKFTRQVCPGSKQNHRNAKSDARPLWNGEPNTRFEQWQDEGKNFDIEGFAG